jgi:hypothetical protein
MKQHPVRTALEQLADRPSAKFRDDLRAQLLADLVAPTATDTSHPTSHQPAQEIIMTNTNDRPPSSFRGRRALLGVAAAVLIAAGVTAVVINRNNVDTDSAPAGEPTVSVTVVDTIADTTTSSTTASTTIAPTTTVASRDDATIAAALLLYPPNGGFDNLEAFEIMRSVEGCEDVVATLDPAEAAASNSGGGMYQWVLVFPTEEAAASAMAVVSSPAGQACDVTMDRLLAAPSADGITAEIVDAPTPAPQADSQVAWVVNVASDGTTMFHKRTAWVQVDRSLIYIQFVGSLTDATFDAHETALSDAVELATAELAAG